MSAVRLPCCDGARQPPQGLCAGRENGMESEDNRISGIIVSNKRRKRVDINIVIR